jgi:hypothetical protein
LQSTKGKDMALICVRVLAEIDNKVFRDIEILDSSNFVELHDAIKKAYDFTDKELASFYLSDADWEKGDEIVLDDLGEGDTPPLIMKDTLLSDQIFEKRQHLFYVYDFLMCKTFFVEVLDISDAKEGITYPRLLRSVGETPEYEDPLANLSADDFMDDIDDEYGDEPKMESFDDPNSDFGEFEDYGNY